MDLRRIESALQGALSSTTIRGCPPRLASAVHYAVFPGGARVRPRLCLAVAAACGDDAPRLADASAAALELLHCASLVHDDLPCFDDSPTRRGRPSVHSAFGERLAVLAGDALIITAFEVLAGCVAAAPGRVPAVLSTVAAGVGLPGGAVAGQAWECESQVCVAEYQRAKTGALFASATMAGAQAAGADPAPWRLLGERLGEAYQVADDIRDAIADPVQLGKPVGRDAALGRPSVLVELDVPGAVERFHRLLADAAASIPDCRGAGRLRMLLRHEAERLVPASSVALAA